MGSNISSKKQSVDELMAQFENNIYEVNNKKQQNRNQSSPGSLLYKAYESEYLQNPENNNPLRKFNNIRFFSKVRGLQCSKQQMKIIEQQMNGFTSTGYEYFKLYEKTAGEATK